MLACNMENSFVFVVAKLEVRITILELLFNHLNVIICDRIVQRQGSVVVRSVRPRVDLIYNRVLLMHAYHMFNGAALIVLCAASFEEIVAAHKPSKDFLITVASALEQAIFT